MTERTDAELVGLFAAGGADAERAFAEIVRRHGAMVYAACRRQLAAEAAEDAVQAVFMLLVRKAHALSAREALAGWLHGAAGLVAREHLRAARRRARAEKEAAEMREAGSGPAGGAGTWREFAPELDAALGSLPAQYRDAVVLSCLEGRPEAEVARELGVPAGTVKSRVSRGLERLRERFAQRGRVTSASALIAMLGAHGMEPVPAALGAKLAGLGAAGALAAGAGTGMAGTAMMEGAMKAMFWMKVKLAAAVLAGVAVVGGGGAAAILAASAGEPAGAEAARKPEPVKPVEAGAGKVAWGEAVNGLQAGLVPLGGDAAKGWQGGHCMKCPGATGKRAETKCEGCGKMTVGKLCESCAVEKRACQDCGVAKPWGAVFTEGEPIRLELHIRNTGDKGIVIYDINNMWVGWEVVLVPLDGGKTIRDTTTRPTTATYKSDITLNRGDEQAKAFTFSFAKQLRVGKYRVTMVYDNSLEKPVQNACWHGKVTTGEVEIEIKAKDAAAGGPALKLFADEDWYKNQSGKEQTFTGKLEGVPVAEGMATTFQRDSYYKLGNRTIYTGAKKVPALDALVGKTVEITGKAVDMNGLEGRNVREIWPASVKAAE